MFTLVLRNESFSWLQRKMLVRRAKMLFEDILNTDELPEQLVFEHIFGDSQGEFEDYLFASTQHGSRLVTSSPSDA